MNVCMRHVCEPNVAQRRRDKTRQVWKSLYKTRQYIVNASHGVRFGEFRSLGTSTSGGERGICFKETLSDR